MKIELPCFQQEQDHTCLPACVRIVLHQLGIQLTELEIGRACQTTPLGTDREIAAAGLSGLGYKITQLQDAPFATISHFIQQHKPVIVFLNVSLLPYARTAAGTHAVVVNDCGTEEVSFIDPARGEEIEISSETFIRAWQDRGCRGLVVEL